MRILHVYRTYFPDTQGGLEEAIRQICSNTQCHGIDSRVFCLSRNPQPQVVHRPEAAVYRAPLTFEIASCGFSARALTLFRQQVAWADIVHYHFPWPFADLLHLAAQVKKPTIVTYQSDIVRQKLLSKCYQPLMDYFLSSVDRIIATSPNYFSTSEPLSHYADKVEIIPIGLDPASYPEVSQSALDNVRARHGDSYFLFVGVLRYYKGLHVLLEAVQNAAFQVVIVGSGPVEAELKKMALRLALTNVTFLGFVDDETKVALYRQALAVVFPSHLRSEAFGVTLVEGAMFKKPLISADIGSGMSYINIDGSTGLTVPPRDPESLRTAMDTMYADQSWATQLGQQAYQRYLQLFTGQRMGELYAQLYNEIS